MDCKERRVWLSDVYTGWFCAVSPEHFASRRSNQLRGECKWKLQHDAFIDHNKPWPGHLKFCWARGKRYGTLVDFYSLLFITSKNFAPLAPACCMYLLNEGLCSASCQLRVVSCELSVASWFLLIFCELRFGFPSYQFILLLFF